MVLYQVLVIHGYKKAAIIWIKQIMKIRLLYLYKGKLCKKKITEAKIKTFRKDHLMDNDSQT